MTRPEGPGPQPEPGERRQLREQGRSQDPRQSRESGEHRGPRNIPPSPEPRAHPGPPQPRPSPQPGRRPEQRGHAPLAERLYSLLLRLYPPAFRREYGAAMLHDFRDWRAGVLDGPVGAGPANGEGLPGGPVDRLATRVRFWAAVTGDLLRSVPREWGSALRQRLARRRRASGARAGAGRPADPLAPPYVPAAVAGLAVFALYLATLAPTIAFWDSGEYVTVAHILGIPHPPGNPLFVLLARGWELLLAPLGLPVVVRINLFSAALSAAAHAVWFLVVDRALAGWAEDRVVRRLGASAAVLLSATAFTVWSQSNVNEKVYTVSLLTIALATWLAFRWRDVRQADGRRSVARLLAIVFLVALTATNHLMGVLVLPALAVFVLSVDARPLGRPRLWLGAGPLVALALSVHFFLPIRAAQRPLVSEGEPTCESVGGAAASVFTWGTTGCDALSTVLTREQYRKPSVLADPTDPAVPRGPDLLAAQALNWLQYFDWQWARSVDGRDPLLGGLRPLVTLLFLLLGLLGARTHWRADRRGAVLVGVLFATLSAGLVLYLNFRYGYSIARDRFPAADMHEVRERDYFFLIGFSVWGLWAGIGLTTAWRKLAALADRASNRLPAPPRLVAAPVLALALLPLALNWGWASRTDDYTARDWAYNVLMSVQPYGVLVTNGDNDSFPLWYLQKVEGVRKDVTIVLSPYLNLPWYVRQIRDLTRPCPPGVDPDDHPTRIVCQRPFRPDQLPDPLRALGWADGVKPPRDSIVRLSDDEIDRLAGFYVTPRPMTLRAGRLRTTIAAGTTMSPADTFAAAILQATIGERTVHFMPGSSHVATLGLARHTVRQGVTWRIAEQPATRTRAAAGDGARVASHGSLVVWLPDTALSPMVGAAVDLAITDTLLDVVYLRRGRILDSDAPWVDHATVSIPFQYVYAHHAAARGHAARGDEDAARRHARHGAWWERAATGG